MPNVPNPNPPSPPFVLGTRGSDLALWQSRWVAARIGVPVELRVITTSGDRILDHDLTGAEGKGFFTKELEEALYARSIDLAVHSLKDLPVEPPPGLRVAAVCERAPVADLLLVNPQWHDASRRFPVKPGGRVGASSLRRQAQVRAAGPDMEPASLRGNVPTRVRKCREGQYAAVVLAEAGVSRLRLDLSGVVAYRLRPEFWLPAPGQGALAIETRADDAVEPACRTLEHAPTREATALERALLERFGGGCHLPLGTWARRTADGFHLLAAFAPEPDRLLRCSIEAPDARSAVEGAYATLSARAASGAREPFPDGALCEPLAAWS